MINKEDGGGGLGFFMILKNISYLAIHLKEHEKTEIICAINLGKTKREFQQSSKSFFFLKEK